MASSLPPTCCLSETECNQLYEDALCREQQVEQQVKALLLKKPQQQQRPNDNSNNDSTSEVLANRACQAILSRTRRLGVLQCSTAAALQENNSSSAAVSAASAAVLLERVKLETDHGRRNNANENHARALSSMLTKTKNLCLVHESANVLVDVDAFFEEYPHCMRPENVDDESESSSDSDSDSDVGIVEPPPQLPPRPPAAAVVPAARQREQHDNNNNNNRHNDNVQVLHPTLPTPPEQLARMAPAICTRPHNNAPIPPPPLPPDRYNHNHNNHNHDNTSWEDHRSQNPFQTAREYSQAGPSSTTNKSNNNTVPESHIQQQQQQQQQGPTNPYYPNHQQQQQQQHHQHQQQQQAPSFFYSQQQQQQQVQTTMVGGYNPYATTTSNTMNLSSSPAPPEVPIRDSLKRKFQPPKRSDAADNNNNNRQNNRQNNNNKAAGAVSSRGPTSSGGGGRGGGGGGRVAATTTTNNNKKDDDDDDDELPEELQRYGKDLVRKIQDEIMDSSNGMDPITFDDIAGLDDAKQTVQEVVCWPMKRPDLFTGLRRAPNGLLLYGPPGTGKTLIGKAIAHESGATFFSISSSSLTSKWIGEGEKLVRTLFAVAAYYEPAVVFIDEIDSLLTQRKADENEASRRIKTEFLVQLDGTGTTGQGRVLVIGATNRPQELDEAARRRFVKRLYIPLPEEADRERLLHVMLKTNHHTLTNDDVKRLAKDTEGFSGADLKALSTDAAMGPIRALGARALQVQASDVPPIAYKHFRQALRGTRPSVAPADLVQYVEWDETYGSIAKRAAKEEKNTDDDDEEED